MKGQSDKSVVSCFKTKHISEFLGRYHAFQARVFSQSRTPLLAFFCWITGCMGLWPFPCFGLLTEPLQPEPLPTAAGFSHY